MLPDGPDAVARRYRMVEPEPAMVGPNAVLQSVTAMRRAIGEERTQAVLRDAQIAQLPAGDRMIPEIEAIRLHRWLALREPLDCHEIAEVSGTLTADYIIAHRIPGAAAWMLRHVPAALAAPLLMQAIRRHAWTFIGAGHFEPLGAWRFRIDRSRADDAVLVPDTLFHWYAAVFTRLYQRLVRSDSQCRDIGTSGGGPYSHQYVIERQTDRSARRPAVT